MSIDLDRSLISLLTDITCMRKAFSEGIRPVHIVGVVEKEIYRFQEKYWLAANRDKVATPDVLIAEFNYAIDQTIEESIEWVVERMLLRYIKNQIDDKLVPIAQTNANPVDSRTAAKMMFDISTTVLSQTETRKNKTNTQLSVQDRRNRYEKRASFDGSVKGAPIGFKEIDEHTFGIHPGELAVIGAGPKTGKTMALAQSALAARKAGWIPYIATLEISTADFEDRVDAIASGVCAKRLGRGKLDHDEVKRLYEAQDKLAELGPMHIEKLSRGNRTVKYICARAREKGANFIIIDQLSFLEASRSTRSATDAVNDIIPELVSNISENEDDMIPVLLAAQLNRKSKETKDKIRMDHFALSTFIEQFANMMFGLSAEEEDRAMHSMKFDILGSRRTDNKSWMLEWELSDKATRFGVRRELNAPFI